MEADTTPVVEATGTVDRLDVAADVELSLDELVGAGYDDHPDLKGGHKGLPDYKKILEHLPENGRKLLGNLRASYTTKTQEIAELKAQLAEERAQLQRDRELMTSSEFAKNVATRAAAPLVHDAWSDEGLEERINQRAAKQMQELLAPLQEDLASAQRTASLETFKAKNPDLTSDAIRMPVAKLLMERPELRLEDAYHIIKGQLSSLAIASGRAAAKETLLKTSTGTAVRGGEAPKFKDAYQAFLWHKQNGMK